MNHDEYMSKLRDLASLMSYLSSEDEGLSKAVTGLNDVCKQLDAYVNRLEYAQARESFCNLTPEFQEKFLIEARYIYEGEDK